MKFGLPISVLLHTSVLFGGLLLVGRPVPSNLEGRVIPVELITVSDTTNIRAAIKGNEEIIPETPMRLENPLDNAPEEDTANEAVRDNDTPNPEPEATQNTPDDAADTPIPEPETKPVTQPEKKPLDLDKFAALIDKSRNTQPEKNQQKTLQSETNVYEFAQTARAGSGAENALTLNERDALQSRMYQCWRIPVDAVNPEELVVQVKVWLLENGTVQRTELQNRMQISASGNPYLKVAAERALRAVSKCAPYDFLPREKYDEWQEMVLTFRPVI